MRLDLQLRAAMAGADAIVYMQNERVPGTSQDLWCSSGNAVRAVDQDGRRQLVARWFDTELMSLGGMALKPIGFLIVISLLLRISSLVTPRDLPGMMREAGEIAMDILAYTPIVLLGLLRLLPWPQLIRPTVAALGFASVYWLVACALRILGYRYMAPVDTIFIIIYSLLIFSICRPMNRLYKSYQFLIGSARPQAPLQRRLAGSAFWIVFLLYVMVTVVRETQFINNNAKYNKKPLDLLAESDAMRFFDRGVSFLKDQPAEAENSFRQALKRFEELADRSPQDPSYRFNAAASSFNLGQLAQESGRFGEADERYRHSIVSLERLVSGSPATQDFRERLIDYRSTRAFLLLRCPDPAIHNPSEAIRLAQNNIDLDQNNLLSWRVLGLAYLGAGSPKLAIPAIEKAMARSDGGEPWDWFYLCESYASIGDSVQARRWYDKATQWVATHRPDDADLRALRAEAARLLGESP